ncbi:dolichol-phosphate mannosyltransferase subunit 3-domain-containing protein, partial [Jimgerdemannia flammicorona]
MASTHWPWSFHSSPDLSHRSSQLPWWALVTFGSYSLGNIGFHVMTFGDCPEAYHELMGEIQEAKNDLRTKGVSVD